MCWGRRATGALRRGSHVTRRRPGRAPGWGRRLQRRQGWETGCVVRRRQASMSRWRAGVLQPQAGSGRMQPDLGISTHAAGTRPEFVVGRQESYTSSHTQASTNTRLTRVHAVGQQLALAYAGAGSGSSRKQQRSPGFMRSGSSSHSQSSATLGEGSAAAPSCHSPLHLSSACRGGGGGGD